MKNIKSHKYTVIMKINKSRDTPVYFEETMDYINCLQAHIVRILYENP